MSACIAGIGSRHTPNKIRMLMTRVGEWCHENDVYVRSGHAPGADYAFEKGAQKHAIVYLPWKGFNSDQPYKTPYGIILDGVHPVARKAAYNSVHFFHPNPLSLTRPVMKLMARNYLQVMGSKENPNPVMGVVCWTPGGSGKGGTGQALRIAKHHKIGILDLGHEANRHATLKTVINWITLMRVGFTA